MLSKRVKVVIALGSTLMRIPFASVFWTVRPVMFSVGRADAVEPTLKPYVPDTLRMMAPVFDAFRVPSMVSVLVVAIWTLPPLVAIVSAPPDWTVRPPWNCWAALPTV